VVFERDLPSDEQMSFADFINIDFTKYDPIADKNHIGSYYFVHTKGEYLEAIDRGYAVILGRYWTNQFDAGWVLNSNRRSSSAHATLGAGYGNNNQDWEVNSWGKNWGLAGTFRCPLDQLEGDMRDFGAVAITPIQYTPKEVKIASLLDIIKKLKDKVTNIMNASSYLRDTAYGLLGKNLAPKYQPAGCAASISYIVNKTFQETNNWVSTTDLYNALSKSPK